MNYADLSIAIADWLNKDNLDNIIPTLIRFGQLDLESKLRVRAMQYLWKTSTYTASTISFVSGTPGTINDSTNMLSRFSAGDTLTITGSSLNNNTLTVSVGGVAGTIRTTEATYDESEGAAITITSSRQIQPVLPAASSSLAIPSDYIELKYLTLIRDNTRYPIELRTDIKELHTLSYDLTTTDTPVFIARVGDYFYFDVIADLSYIIDCAYYRHLPMLTSAAAYNTNWWSLNAEEAFLLACLNKASLYVTGIPEGDKVKWAAAYEENIKDMMDEDLAEDASGVIIRSEPFK